MIVMNSPRYLYYDYDDDYDYEYDCEYDYAYEREREEERAVFFPLRLVEEERADVFYSVLYKRACICVMLLNPLGYRSSLLRSEIYPNFFGLSIRCRFRLRVWDCAWDRLLRVPSPKPYKT